MLESRVSKPEDFSEPKAISLLIKQGNLSIPAKSWVDLNQNFFMFFFNRVESIGYVFADDKNACQIKDGPS